MRYERRHPWCWPLQPPDILAEEVCEGEWLATQSCAAQRAFWGEWYEQPEGCGESDRRRLNASIDSRMAREERNRKYANLRRHRGFVHAGLIDDEVRHIQLELAIETIIATRPHAERQPWWMNKYREALEELDRGYYPLFKTKRVPLSREWA